MLCDIAMCGDHGIGECYGSVLDLPKCIAKGDDVCSLRYHKKNVQVMFSMKHPRIHRLHYIDKQLTLQYNILSITHRLLFVTTFFKF